MDAQTRVSLTDGHHLQSIDIDVFWQRSHPPDRFGNIFRRQGVSVFIGLFGFCVITFKTHIRELRTAYQSRFDIGHANSGTVKVGAQIQAELPHKGFGGAIDIATGQFPAVEPMLMI